MRQHCPKTRVTWTRSLRSKLFSLDITHQNLSVGSYHVCVLRFSPLGRRKERKTPTQTPREACWNWGSNLQPSCCEATALTTTSGKYEEIYLLRCSPWRGGPLSFLCLRSLQIHKSSGAAQREHHPSAGKVEMLLDRALHGLFPCLEKHNKTMELWKINRDV